MDLAAQRVAYGRKLDEAVQTVVDRLSRVEGVERISLFGSYSRGARDLGTDLDVLVLWQTDRSFVDRLRYLYSVVQVPVDLDMICYTPDEYLELRRQPFLRQVARDEVVLYARQTPPMIGSGAGGGPSRP